MFGALLILGVIVSTIWATIDASNIQSYKYRGGYTPFLVFISCALLWIIFFPVYLVKRSGIVNGITPLRPEFENDPPPTRALISHQQTSQHQPHLQQQTIVQSSPVLSDAEKYEKLEKLGELKAKGLLTEEEFSREKAKLLEA